MRGIQGYNKRSYKTANANTVIMQAEDSYTKIEAEEVSETKIAELVMRRHNHRERRR